MVLPSLVPPTTPPNRSWARARGLRSAPPCNRDWAASECAERRTFVYGIVYNSSVLTLSQAAVKLGIQAATLRRQIHRKKLRARKRRLGAYEVWVVSESEVERYARENKK